LLDKESCHNSSIKMFLRLLATAECLNNNNKKKITKKESLTILAILAFGEVE